MRDLPVVGLVRKLHLLRKPLVVGLVRRHHLLSKPKGLRARCDASAPVHMPNILIVPVCGIIIKLH